MYRFLKIRALISKISILLFAGSIVAFPQDDIRVLSSDQNSIVIEYKQDYANTSTILIDNQSYHKIDITYGFVSNTEKWGNPSILERVFNIGVPSEFGNTIEVIRTEYSEIEGLISPIPRMTPDGNSNKLEYLLNEAYHTFQDNPELVVFGEFGIARGIQTQTIRILPIKFNPAEFVDRCQQETRQGELSDATRRLALQEWKSLFEFCFQGAQV